MNPDAPGIWRTAALVWCDTGRVVRKLPVLTFVALLVVLALELVLFYIPTVIWTHVPVVLLFAGWLIAHPFLLAPCLIAMHRFIILGEATARYRLVPTEKRFQRYFAWSLVPAAMIPAALRLIHLISRDVSLPGVISTIAARRAGGDGDRGGADHHAVSRNRGRRTGRELGARNCRYQR
jgi:hypothetical protein